MTELASSALTAAWTWSVALVFVTIAIHVSGIALIALVVPRWTEEASSRKSFIDTVPGAALVIAIIAFTLVSLHGIEALVWAIVYFQLKVLVSMPDAILYSLGSMSTAGSGLSVHVQWRLMGVIESFSGVLLFGISTAFLFSFMRLLWRSVSIRHDRNRAT
jgi:predicted small integral membrane protein